MAARRMQVRQVFQSVPSADLSGTTLEALYARCEANLAAVDAWSTQGNQRAVRQAGTGLVAICAWMATKDLADHAQSRPFQNASGLSPSQFNASEIELMPAIRRIASTSSAVSTPRKIRQPDASTAEAMAQWVKDIKSGITPSKRSSGPLTPSSGRRGKEEAAGADTMTGTPSRSGLRDRSAIKVKTLFDPSPVATPTKARSAASRINTPASVAGSSLSPVKHATFSSTITPQIKGSNTVSPVKPSTLSVKRPKRYATVLSCNIDNPDFGRDRWDEREARKCVKRCLDTLALGGRSDPWTRSPGSVELVRLL